ncbi:MAG: hypothetical protein GWP63_21330 [Haliea sp.]|jgi:hypothetical protein|nr:hypothetical protein [Haliea sp.]
MIRATNAIAAIVLIAAASHPYAGTLDLLSFRIDLPDGWTYSVEAGPGDERGDAVTFRHTDDNGHLKIMSYDAPVAITEDRLRNLTNVDARVPLAWQHWGEFAGYHYAYEEQGAFYRQWFLVNGQTLLLVTYQGDPFTKYRVAADLDRMIRSLTVNPPPAR